MNDYKNFPIGEPDSGEVEAIEQAKKEGVYYTQAEFDQLKKESEYSGKISLRVPKSLHRQLVEQARQEGVSLNQYALYKLSTDIKEVRE